MPIGRIAACGRDARAPCLSPPISRLTSSRIAACGRDARAPRHAGDARYLSRPFRCSLARTQAYRGGAAVRARHAVPQHLSNTPERPQVAPAEIHLIDLIVFAPGARSRRSTVLRFAAEGVLSRRARTRYSRSASGRVCAACLVPVRVLSGHLKAPSQRSKWKSSDRCNGKDRPQVSQQNTHPPNRAGMNDRTHLSCLFIPCACIVPSIIGDRRSRLSYTDADRSATEEKPDAAEQDKEANPSEHQPDNR